MTTPITGMFRGSWTTYTGYARGDLVVWAGAEYVCVDAHTSGQAIDTARFVGADLDRTIPEGSTVTFARPLMVDPNTAGDMLEFRYDGQRTGYYNEYGELRVIAAKDNTVPVRVKQHGAGQSGNLTEWVDIGNAVLASVGPAGALAVPALTVGGSSVAVGAWGDLSLPAGMSHGTVHAAARTEPFGAVRVRGSLSSDVGTGFTAGATIATLPAGTRPSAAMTFPSRQAGAGIALTRNTDGTVTSSSTIGTGGGVAVLLDNIAFSTT